LAATFHTNVKLKLTAAGIETKKLAFDEGFDEGVYDRVPYPDGADPNIEQSFRGVSVHNLSAFPVVYTIEDRAPDPEADGGSGMKTIPALAFFSETSEHRIASFRLYMGGAGDVEVILYV